MSTKKFIIMPFIVLIAACGGKTDTTEYAYAEVVLDSFFEACTAVDSNQIETLSTLSEYPLATSWTVRRISERQPILRTTMRLLSDSVRGVWREIVDLQDRITAVRDSVDFFEEHYSTKLSHLQADYERAEREYQAKLEVYRQSHYDQRHKAAVLELEGKRDAIGHRYLRLYEQYESEAKEAQAGVEMKAANLTNLLSELKTQHRAASVLLEATRKSLEFVETADSITVQITTAIVDIQIPSRAGLLLNKKCRVTLLCTDQGSPNSRWIVTKLGYFGEDE